jgi:branched-chain amino acid transport system permease protein
LMHRIFDRPAGAVISIERLMDENELSTPADSETGDTAVLRLRGANKSFGAVRALADMSLEVRPGEVHALVGPNGSGKTTLLNALSGFVRLESGQIEIDGARVARWSSRRRNRQGLGRTFQTPRVFEDMSVWENIDVTRSTGGGVACLSPIALSRVQRDWQSIRAATLAHGQRRLLELVRVLQAKPRILLLDEPAAGLSPQARAEFAEALRLLSRNAGIAVVLVEHDLRLVWDVADRVTVMENGSTAYAGAPNELDLEALEAVFMLSGSRADSD